MRIDENTEKQKEHGLFQENLGIPTETTAPAVLAASIFSLDTNTQK